MLIEVTVVSELGSRGFSNSGQTESCLITTKLNELNLYKNIIISQGVTKPDKLLTVSVNW